MTFDNRVMCLPRMVWSFVVLFMLFYTQIIPVSAASPDLASNLTVEAITAAGATVRWAQSQTSATFENYRVSISPNNLGIVFTPGPLISSNATETVITNLTPGVEYTVSVRTVNGSDEGTPKTAKLTTKPEKVDYASITVGNTATTTMATLTWGEVTTQFQTYEIAITPTTGGAKANPASVDNGTTTTNLESLTPGTLYNVYINTKNGQLESENATMTFTTKPQPVDQLNIFVNAATNTATVSWEKVAIGSFDAYSISIQPTATISSTPVASSVAAPTVNLSGLEPGMEYTLTLKTVSGGIESDDATKTFWTKPMAVDAGKITPADITISTASVSWTPVASADSYSVAISPSTSATPNIAHSPKSSTTATFSALSPGVEYNVSITSMKGVVTGDATLKTFRTKPPNLVGPVVLDAVEMNTATATWKRPGAGTFTSYTINVTADEDGLTPPTVTPPSVLSSDASPSVNLSNLVAGQVYTVSVSTNWDGVEGSATTKKFRTKPLQVSSIAITDLTTTTATITWTSLTLAAKYNSIYKYKVEIVPSVQSTPNIAAPMVQHPGNSAGVTGMISGTMYQVKVTTIAGKDSLEAMSDPTEYNFTAKPTPVTQNTIKFVNVTNETATAIWGTVSVGEKSEYEVSISPAGPVINPSPVPGTTDPPTTDLTNLVPGTLYNLTVITLSGTTESTPSSATFTAKPMSVNANRVQVTAITIMSASVSWPKINEGLVTSYTATINEAGTVNPATVTSLENPSVQLTGLTAGTEYTIAIFTNSGDVKSEAVQKKFHTMAEQVTGITVETVTTTTATITWLKVSSGGVDHYSISVSPVGATITPATVGGSETNPQTSLSQLRPGVQYNITISSIAGNQTTSASKTFFTKPHPVSVSTMHVKNVTSESALLTWDEVVTGEFESYRVSISPTGPTIIPASINSNETRPSSLISDLSPGVEYTVIVVTVAGDMASDPSDVKFRTIPRAVDVDSIVIDSSAIDTANVTWAMVNGTVDTYTIEVSPSGPTVTPSSVNSGDAPFSSLTNLLPGARYNVTIMSVSGDQSSASTSKSFWTKPSSVTDVNLEQNIDKMNITWKAMAGSTQSSYKIRSHAIFENITSNWSEVTETSKVISIKAGEKYKVEVIAISGDQSSDAASATLETAPFPPAEASVDKSAATITSIEVTWTAPTPASYITKYIIKYTKEGNLSTPSQVEATTKEIRKTIPSLEAGVKYNIQIFTESTDGKMSATSTNTTGTAKPNCDVVVTDLSTEEDRLKANFTASKLVFTEYKFVITFGLIPPTMTLPKNTTITELVYDKGVQPGNRYTLRASCVSNGVESNATEYFVSSVPAPVTEVEPVTPSHIEVNMTIYKPEGANSGLEITCSGPSPTNLNGCAFPKSRQFSDNTLLVTYDKLDAAEEYNFTIVVISNNKRSAPKIVTVKTLPGRPGPPNEFTASAPSPTSVELVWKTPIDSNGLISTYVVKYTGIYKDKNNLNLNLPNDKKTVTFDGLDPNAGSYYKTLDGLKGGYEYNLLLYGKTSYPDPGVNANTIITMPIAAPTLAANAKPPERTDTTNETSVTVVFSKAFNWSNGPILYYSIIVAENRDGPPLSNEILPERALFTWKQVWTTSHWEPYISIFQCDIFDKKKPCDGSQSVSRRKRSTTDNTVKVTIGIQDCKNKVGSVYCNGALRAGTYYQFRLRGYTGEGKYNDTPYSQRIPTKPVDQTGIIVGVTVGLIVLLFIVGGLAIFFFIKCRKAERERKYKESETEAPPSSPTDRNRPVRLSDFPGHHAFMHADTDFRFAEEYEDLKDVGITQSFQASEVPHNRVKNRFTNILPYDRSRVKLSPCEDEEGSDYINANYIPGFTSKREYIACQGPLASTKDDFWRMIWEQNCQAIVMLTRCVENGREKCSHYWPGDTDPVMYGDIEVVILNETQTQDYSITQFRLTKGEEVRRICHYHFMAWPDFSAPDTSGPLLRFLRTFREREGFGNSRPLCVHCSAGVGRSGTFITLDRLTQHMKQHDYVDIYGTVYEMRMHRRYMVQTEQQYIFIHRAILDIINDTEKSSPPSSPAQGRENPAFEELLLLCDSRISSLSSDDIPLNDLKISDDEGITLEVLS
ncbi:tyrosine-protein phosphatase 10D-like isoform X2 [Lineus longissimus]|uniref:tyrosine-protein phosphatase 10D-like isoform X2 n=1 Tax=Lineus longissimus TaxID=88925 RepID=UPI00315D5B05